MRCPVLCKRFPFAFHSPSKTMLYTYWSFGRFYSKIARQRDRCHYTTEDIRNIGIMAHIDAGKTTLAEAMLHESRRRESLNDSCNSSVQLDYLEQEIKRGITIRAACSSFNWGKCHVNIVDTPGHTDFSGEVYNAMDVIDGSIIIVDGTRGIQAQTKHIYSSLPKTTSKIIFINKIDRPGVDVEENVQSIRKSLHVNPILLNTPISHPSASSAELETVSIMEISNDQRPEYKMLINNATDTLCAMDEHFADLYLNNDSINRDMLLESLRRNARDNDGRFSYTSSQKHAVVPVICGSAVSMTGVCQLLDFLCDYFPSPSKKLPPSTHSNDAILYTFKTICGDNDHINAFCKVIKGTVTPNVRLHNLVSGKAEQASRIHKINGNTYNECTRLIEGDIGMIGGMREVRTGHLLSTNPKSISQSGLSFSYEADTARKCVCFATFTTKDEKNMTNLLEAMRKLRIEDPSMFYKYDPDAVAGLTVGGLGEFHLEILAEILRDNYGIAVQIGQVKVALKEMPTEKAKASLFIDNTNPEDRSYIGLELIMEPIEMERGNLCALAPCNGSANTSKIAAPVTSDDKGIFNCQINDDSISFIGFDGLELENVKDQQYWPKTDGIVSNVKQLLLNAMGAGPLIGEPLISTRIRISKIKILPHSTVAGAKVIASKVLKLIYKKVQIELQQPMISLNITVPREYVGNVLQDLRNNRKAEIVEVSDVEDPYNKSATIVATGPMKELLGYTKVLRSLTNGNATFNMTRSGYAPIPLSEVYM